MKKKDKILYSALKLFAQTGYYGTSTKQIAQDAEVSEPLIFSYYETKEGLLTALFAHAQERALQYLDWMQDTTLSAQEKVLKFIDMPVTWLEHEPEFMKLSLAIKIQHYDLYMRLAPQSDMLQNSLVSWLQEAGYADANKEAEEIIVFLEGVVATCVRKGVEHVKPIVARRKQKYQ